MRRTLRAFTLVELLVVIGIIALLISILLPSLNNARRAAMATKCLSNLRSIGQAVNMYANDNKGAIVPSDVQVGNLATGEGDGGTNREYWPVLLVAGRYLPTPNVNGNDPTPIANSVFMCPAGRMSLVVSRNWLDKGSKPIHFDDSDDNAANATQPLAADGVRRTYSCKYLSPTVKPLPANAGNGFRGGAIIDCNYAISGTSGPKVGVSNDDNVASATYLDQYADKYLPAQTISDYKGNTRTHGVSYKLSSFKRAANVPFIMDGIGDNLYNTAKVQGGNIWRITGARHGQRLRNDLSGNEMFKIGTTNVLFLDGHVEGMPREMLPFASGGGNGEKSGKAQMLCSRAKVTSLPPSPIVWNLRQQ